MRQINVEVEYTDLIRELLMGLKRCIYNRNIKSTKNNPNMLKNIIGIERVLYRGFKSEKTELMRGTLP